MKTLINHIFGMAFFVSIIVAGSDGPYFPYVNYIAIGAAVLSAVVILLNGRPKYAHKNLKDENLNRR